MKVRVGRAEAILELLTKLAVLRKSSQKESWSVLGVLDRSLGKEFAWSVLE